MTSGLAIVSGAFVIPAKAGIQRSQKDAGALDSRLRGNDGMVIPAKAGIQEVSA